MISMKLQTKFAFAFLGSAFLVLMIWDRGSKTVLDEGEEHEDDITINYGLDKSVHYFEPDRILTRSKRATVQTYRTLSNIYNTFQGLKNCCPIPPMLSLMAINRCLGQVSRQGANKKSAPVRNWFDGISRSFLTVPRRRVSAKRRTNTGTAGNRVRVNANRRGKRAANQAQKITLSSVCYTDCIFNAMNFMNQSAMDLQLIEDTFSTQPGLTDVWKNAIKNAMYDCEEPAACASPEVVQVSSKYCSIKPTILMNCMRKRLFMDCPGGGQMSAACKTRQSALRGLNTVNFG